VEGPASGICSAAAPGWPPRWADTTLKPWRQVVWREAWATLLAASGWELRRAPPTTRAVALISHLPVLVSAALLGQAAERGSAAAVAEGCAALVRGPLASSGFC